ncbi:phosphoesterase [Candidatus Omnitrophus magneticus]|uniref:Phosphoesterase n=1 Tax=Candidatus Omnitrophus magneticus TaxID=1609969 RepID=A0A0F0CNX6_9BACT|nr:phosphoesterase [Candidatus Omnitrophus magneticus]
MKIVVLSDTHIPDRYIALPPILYKNLEDCDLIIHAGDFVGLNLLDEFKKYAEVKAVAGNMDEFRIKKSLPEKLICDIDGYKIGITHGTGTGEKILDNAQGLFSKLKLDIIIFGHSHLACNKKIGDTIFFNPGSPTDDFFSPYKSFGIIHIADGKIKPEIIKI